MKERICMSFCDGFCGMCYDPEDPDTWPSSMGDPESELELCLDDGEDKGCDEFYCAEDDE